MSAKATQNDSGTEAENDQASIEAAYEAVGEALQELNVSEHFEQYRALQEQYFELKAAVLARDEEFQDVDLGGTDLYVPSIHNPSVTNPTVQDELGEVEIPTRDDHFSVLAGIVVADPENPHVSHGVHIDHVVERDGEVRLEVNGIAIDELV